MSWAFAWDSPDGDAERASASATTWGARAILLFLLVPASWLLAYGLGLFTTLGWAEGSETHDRFGVYREDRSVTGLNTMYLLAGQRAWWDYDMRVEGRGGLRLTIARSIPRPGQVRFEDVDATAAGRFEFVAPESGFYRFSLEHVPNPGRFGRQRAGSTVYRLSWGAD